jgi:glycosyltransferase involved in cell wall biosynthesis
VVRQTLQEIEIILIDDGSTDKSLAILKEYAAKDNRVTVIMQENKGGSAARNAGLRIAIGEYLSFLDSDDFFNETMLEKMYKKAKELDTDITICRTTVIDATSGETLNSPNDWMYKRIPQKQVFTMEDNMDGDFTLGIMSAWDKLFRKSFIDKYCLQFQEIRNVDDVYFVSAALYRAKLITILEERLYIYRMNREGNVSEGLSNNPLAPYEAWSAVKDDLQKLNIFEKIERQFHSYILYHYLWYCFGAIKNVKAFQIFYQALQDHILPEMDLESRPSDYFYGGAEGGLEEAKKIILMPIDEYLFYKWRQAGGYTQNQQGYIQKQQAHIEMQNGRLQELESTLSGKEEYIQKQQAYIETQNGRLQGLETILGEREAYIQKQQAHIDKQSGRLQGLEITVNGKEAYIQKQQEYIETQSERLQGLEAVLGGKEEYIQKQQAYIEMQNGRLQELESMLGEKEEYIEKQQAHIEAQSGRLQELEIALGGKEEYIQRQQAYVETQVETQSGRLQELESLLDLHRNFAKKQVEHIEWQNSEIGKLTAQYTNIINSKSWKLTKPLRKLKKYISKG